MAKKDTTDVNKLVMAIAVANGHPEPEVYTEKVIALLTGETEEEAQE